MVKVSTDGNLSPEKQRAKEIGARIREARQRQKGMRQRDLADMLGVSERMVIAYEQGDTAPYNRMEDLENFLGVSTAWILHGDDYVRRDEDIKELLREVRAMRRELKKVLDSQ